METIQTPQQAFLAIKEHLSYPEQEELWLLSLNNRNKLLSVRFIGLGTDCEVLISTKVIAKNAVVDMAAGVILVHTHPSGNPKPSAADIKATQRVSDALKILEVVLLDHIIVSQDSFFSFAEDSVFTTDTLCKSQST